MAEHGVAALSHVPSGERVRTGPADPSGAWDQDHPPSTATTTQESGLRENRTSRLSERTEEGRKPDLLRLYRQLFLTDRSGVDDGLHAACDPRMAEDKHELIGPIACQLSCVEVFEDVDAILGDEDLVHLEDAHTWLERDRLKAPAVGAYRNHLLTRQILRT